MFVNQQEGRRYQPKDEHHDPCNVGSPVTVVAPAGSGLVRTGRDIEEIGQGLYFSKDREDAEKVASRTARPGKKQKNDPNLPEWKRLRRVNTGVASEKDQHVELRDEFIQRFAVEELFSGSFHHG